MYLAIDVGGTKTLLACFDAEGKVAEEIKFPTPGTYEEFLGELGKNNAALKTKTFTTGAIAIPARIDRLAGVGMSFPNLPWENIPIKKDIETLFGCPVVLENDTKTAAIYEASLVKHEFRKVLYVTISTGIGMGLIIDGRLDPDFADMEVGGMLLEHEGSLQRWEDFASGKALSQKFGKKIKDITDPGQLYIIARNIAIGLIDVIATTTPEVVIIGGGVGAHFDKFGEHLIEELRIYTNPMLVLPQVRGAQNAEEAVIYGCYKLARGHDGKLAA